MDTHICKRYTVFMRIHFSGIGGTAIGPLALIAKQAGYDVSGSDKQDSDYIQYLKKEGVENIVIGQSDSELEALHVKSPIDWLVYSSALEKENPNHPELKKAEELGIKTSKRDEFLNKLLSDTGQKMIAIAGTHGKTTTTAMTIWAFKQLGVPISYSVGAKMSFGEMGEFNQAAEYFVYEADEYDRNFLSFKPEMSIISGVAYDHPDIYPTREDYNNAFLQFIDLSSQVFIWQEDADALNIEPSEKLVSMHKEDYKHIASKLVGRVNRENAALVVQALYFINESYDLAKLSEIMNSFPGVSRRFEKITENVYSDYAHTPEKVRGAIQMAREVATDNVVVVYEGLHNTRQHFIREELATLFEGVKELYIVPSYRARENEELEDLTPEKLCELIKVPELRHPVELNEKLKQSITKHVNNGDLVLCLSAGGGGGLDEWLRSTFGAEKME